MRRLLLNFYNKTNKMKPERIILFRDGVSEGQFKAVQRAEVPQIVACCQELGRASGEDYSPPVCTCCRAPALLNTSRSLELQSFFFCFSFLCPDCHLLDACSTHNQTWSNVRLLTVHLPQVTYIVCQKRHNTRLLPRSPNEADRSGNVPPGTVSLLDMLPSCLQALLISKCMH